MVSEIDEPPSLGFKKSASNGMNRFEKTSVAVYRSACSQGARKSSCQAIRVDHVPRTWFMTNMVVDLDHFGL